MTKTLTLKEADKWLSALADAPTKWGFGANRKIGAYLKKRVRTNFKKQQSSSGRPWAKTYVVPLPQIGEKAAMLLNGGQPYHQKTIQTRAGLRAAKKWRKKHGRPTKPQKALYRSTGPKRNRVRKVFDHLVTFSLTTAKTKAKGKAAGLSTTTAMTMSPNHFFYGYTPGMKWIEKLQFGGRFRSGQVPPREMIGLTEADLKFIDEVYSTAYEKFAARGKQYGESPCT